MAQSIELPFFVTSLQDNLKGTIRNIQFLFLIRYAYIEFADKDAVTNAILLNETLFKGRQLKVSAKRTNVHGLVPRGGRGGFMPRYLIL